MLRRTIVVMTVIFAGLFGTIIAVPTVASASNANTPANFGQCHQLIKGNLIAPGQNGFGPETVNANGDHRAAAFDGSMYCPK